MGAPERGRDVLFFCPKLWGNAAVEGRARIEIRALRAAGRDTHVVTDAAPDEVARARWPAVATPAPRVVGAPRLLAQFSAGKLVAFFVNSVRVLATADWRRLGAVVSHTPVSVVAAYPWCRRHRTPLVYVCHVPPVPADGEHPATGARWPMRLVSGTADWIAIRVADVVTCPSEAARSWHARARPGKCTVRLPNPVDTDRFSVDPSVAKDVDVVFVGRLGPEKGPSVLLHAVALLTQHLRVVLIGEGRERATLEALARNDSSEVLLTGWLPHDALPEWYRRARVVAVPSYFESQGMSAAEAIACGTPVVASAVGGLLDVVHPGLNGWLVPPGDPAALAAALEVALRPGASDGLELGGYEFGEQRFAEEFVDLLAR